MSDWLTASRCVDEYFLILWKKNTAKESSQKLSIANKGTVSFIAEVEACIEYNFAMEFVENDLLKTVSLEIKTSKILKFLTIGSCVRPRIVRVQGYYADNWIK